MDPSGQPAVLLKSQPTRQHQSSNKPSDVLDSRLAAQFLEERTPADSLQMIDDRQSKRAAVNPRQVSRVCCQLAYPQFAIRMSARLPVDGLLQICLNYVGQQANLHS